MIDSDSLAALSSASPERLLGCSTTALPSPNLGRLSVEQRIAFLLDWLISAARADSGAVLLVGKDNRLIPGAVIGVGPADLHDAPKDLGDITFGLMVHATSLGGEGHDDGGCQHWTASPDSRMALWVPLEVEGRMLGAVCVGFQALRSLEPPEVRRIGIIADHIAAVAEAARLARESAARSAEAERASTVLNEIDQMKGDFLSMVSHELRTPLTAIIGYTDLLLRQVHGTLNDRQLRHQSSVKKAAHRLLALVNDLLDLNRLESGHVVLAREDVGLLEIVKLAIGQIEPAAEERNIQVGLRAPSAALVVEADTQRLHQVLMNLLDNAVKFTAPGGSITVEVTTADDRVTVAVIDTGVGVPAEQLARIWDRFHQADSSTRRHFGGTGLGLAIVKHLVTMHGGTVAAQSAGTGKGSSFSLTLPLRPAAARRRAPPAPEPAAVVPDTPVEAPAPLWRTILIVDDEPDNREVITSIVRDILGHRVLAASTGTGALAMASSKPDLILLDLRLPDISGFEVARRLKEGADTAGIPILAITALADEDDRREALAAGCIGWVTKPFGQDALAEAVTSTLSQTAAGTAR